MVEALEMLALRSRAVTARAVTAQELHGNFVRDAAWRERAEDSGEARVHQRQRAE